MKYIILLLVLSGTIQVVFPAETNPSIKLLVTIDEINNILKNFAPLILKEINKHISCLNIDFEKFYMHFHISCLDVNIHEIAPKNIKVGLASYSNQLMLYLTDFCLNGEGHLTHDSIVTPVDTDFTFYTNNVQLNLTIEFLVTETKLPNVTISHVEWYANDDDISVTVDKNGTWTEDVIADILPYFKTEVANSSIESSREAINNITIDTIGNLSNTIELFDNLYIYYEMPYEAKVTSEIALVVDVYGILYDEDVPITPSSAPVDLPGYNFDSDKGIQIYITQFLLDSVLMAFYEAKLMDFDKTTFFSSLSCSATSMPILTFEEDITLSMGARCEGAWIPKIFKNWLHYSFDTEFFCNLKEYIDGKKLYLKITDVDFNSLDIQFPFFKSDVNVDSMIWFFQLFLGGIKQGFNEFFGESGITLPVINGIDYSDMTENVEDGYVEIFISPTFTGSLP